MGGCGRGMVVVGPSPHLRFLFCFNSCICNPLHAARRAMAAALPLPSKGQRRDFQGIPISDLEPACAVIVRCPVSPSSLNTSKIKYRTKENTKGNIHSRRVGLAHPRLRSNCPLSLHPHPRLAKRNPPVPPLPDRVPPPTGPDLAFSLL